MWVHSPACPWFAQISVLAQLFWEVGVPFSTEDPLPSSILMSVTVNSNGLFT